jgi:hypothetical protein
MTEKILLLIIDLGEAVITVDGPHHQGGNGVLGMGAGVVGDVNLFLAIMCVLHEECVGQEGVRYRALGKKPVLGGVHVGAFGRRDV